ncbi:hypothetical protein H4J02_02330 [Protaetiibacter sp. SSC-01]|uniref:hypothetical protein n=1 Tax=Protaetiibacter sp. SSC-01 TaxID=2759943 RepID=UPI0016572155|nr:hypothetical protein [Protaetiibacter sp. SSC-01]QNO37901.1 hypothetical protein H4J02_02330 [Protaetiibacter sp. SSC-01]
MTTQAPSIRPLFGLVGAAGIGLLALSGCAASPSGADGGTGGDGTTGGSGADASYADGDYSAEASYISPAGEESVKVDLTLEGDVVTAVTVTPEAEDPQARSFQEKFASGIADVVVGKDIDDLDVSRVAGSSLTSGGFNKAVVAIKADARA